MPNRDLINSISNQIGQEILGESEKQTPILAVVSHPDMDSNGSWLSTEKCKDNYAALTKAAAEVGLAHLVIGQNGGFPILMFSMAEVTRGDAQGWFYFSDNKKQFLQERVPGAVSEIAWSPQILDMFKRHNLDRYIKILEHNCRRKI